MLTRKENIKKVLARQVPDWVPFSINFYQWFCHHQTFNMLPEELKIAGDYIGAMKILGGDIFSRNVDGGLRASDTAGDNVR